MEEMLKFIDDTAKDAIHYIKELSPDCFYQGLKLFDNSVKEIKQVVILQKTNGLSNPVIAGSLYEMGKKAGYFKKELIEAYSREDEYNNLPLQEKVEMAEATQAALALCYLYPKIIKWFATSDKLESIIQLYPSSTNGDLQDHEVISEILLLIKNHGDHVKHLHALLVATDHRRSKKYSNEEALSFLAYRIGKTVSERAFYKKSNGLKINEMQRDNTVLEYRHQYEEIVKRLTVSNLDTLIVQDMSKHIPELRFNNKANDNE